MTIKLPKKGLKVAHLNICSLKNKVIELSKIMLENDLHIVAISETHLDDSIDNTEVYIQGYNIIRLDRNRYGGGVAFYVQDHIPIKRRGDLDLPDIEAIWIQVHLPHLKPLLVCCCYRPPTSDAAYLEKICTMLQNVSDKNSEMYFVGDLNIDWLSKNCPMKRKLKDTATVCNLVQMINLPTRINMNNLGVLSSTCIDHLFTNSEDKCSKVVSVPIGFSDHNMIAMARKVKVPKVGPKIIYKRLYKNFCDNAFIEDLHNIQWDVVFKSTSTEAALHEFMKLFSSVCDKHAPIKKLTVRSVKAPWLDSDLRSLMKERDEM